MKWDEHTEEHIRRGRERRTPLIESLKLMTQLYRQRLLTSLKPGGKYPSSHSAEEDENGGEEDQGKHDERVSVANRSQDVQEVDSSDGGASQLYSSTRVQLERKHLELFERQVLAAEALAMHTQERLEVAREKVRAVQEQIQVARDQMELNLFVIQADPEDEIAHEYLAMKRKQARDRLKAEFFSLKRKQTSVRARGTSPDAPTTAPMNRSTGGKRARTSPASRAESRRLPYESSEREDSEHSE